MENVYNPKAIETAAQEYWDNNQSFKVTEDPTKEKFYCLSMFPYPSGRCHMGHVRNYTIGDVISRYHKMCGKNVLQPMGWDAFGLPAENAALKNNIAPETWTRSNINDMREQLKRLGFAYDWTREIATCDPSYYRWEQWLFTRLYKKGLVYRKNSLVNWDPVDKTVLANEQVIDGRGWRSGALVEQKEIQQWFLKITDYADELLRDLDKLEEWPTQVRTMQRNWIGRSEGVSINFQVAHHDFSIEVYTTCPDTLFGATFLAIAPQHPLANRAADHDPAVGLFLESCRTTKVAEADMSKLEKAGIDTGFKAIHPITGAELPIWAANFVLLNYGSGAIMAVPAHDQRDWEFATKYNLRIVQVTEPEAGVEFDLKKAAMVGKGKLINSGKYNGMTSAQAFEAIANYLEKNRCGKRQVNYRLRDWGVSRQRYWGTPIPMIHCQSCGPVPVPEKDLPVLLPQQLDARKGILHLAHMPEFYQCTCPKCGKQAKRDTDTFDTFVESSWYYARYACTDQTEKMLDERALYWEPVDQYIGGIEHAILHLLYSRFFHKLLRDEGLLKSDEPFKRLLTQGMVIKDGHKMSKSKGNVVDPQHLIELYGADTVRLFIIFAAPPEQGLEWSDAGVEGAHRYLKRLWKLCHDHLQHGAVSSLNPHQFTSEQSALRRQVHETIRKVSDDIGRRYVFNTAVAACMELTNALAKIVDGDAQDRAILDEGLRALIGLLAPIVPHITHHLWQKFSQDGTPLNGPWPQWDEKALQQDVYEMMVQINGKLRAKIDVPADSTEADIQRIATENVNVQRYLEGATLQKVIVIPKRLVNIVVKGN